MGSCLHYLGTWYIFKTFSIEMASICSAVEQIARVARKCVDKIAGIDL